MSNQFQVSKAIVRDLPNSFAEGLKQAAPNEAIDLVRAQKQHGQYISLLKKIGITVVQLPAIESHPDCCFVEDTAVIIGHKAVINYLGANERRGEENSIRDLLTELKIQTVNLNTSTLNTSAAHANEQSATVDGGDVLYTGSQLIVGLSKRTNLAGAKQLAKIFNEAPVVTVPVSGALHLKSVMSAFDKKTILFGSSAPAQKILADLEKAMNIHKLYEIITLPDDVAANVLSINDKIVMQEGFSLSQDIIQKLASQKNMQVVTVNMSELCKADGALTCCSLLIE